MNRTCRMIGLGGMVAALLLSAAPAVDGAETGAYVFVKVKQEEHVSKGGPLGATELEEFGATSARFRTWAIANNRKQSRDVRTRHTWTAPPTLIRPEAKVETRLSLTCQVLKASYPLGFDASTSIAVNTDRGGPIFTNEQVGKPVRMSGTPGKSGSVEHTVRWKVRAGFKNLYVTMGAQCTAAGVMKVTYIYDWQDTPKPTATVPGAGDGPDAPGTLSAKWPLTADGYPDISGDWIESGKNAIRIVQGPGGKVTATCTYKLGAKTIRWTMAGAIDRNGRFVSKLRHTEGVAPSGLGYAQDRDMQLAADGRTFSGKASFAGGGHALAWTRKSSTGDGGAKTGPIATPTPPVTSAHPGEAGPATVARMTLQAEKRSVKVGQTVSVPIWLRKAKSAANMNFSVHYDPAVAKTTGDCAKGNLLGRAMFEANPKEAGVVRVGFAQNADLSGDGTVVHITFAAVGAPGASTPLRLEVTTVASAAGGKPTVATIDGQILVVGADGGVPGDSDGDNQLTARDAGDALKMSVKLIPVKMVCDMDKDGQVTSTDARLILAKASGK